MSGLRHTALVLHGLADADRAWMLGQLPPEQAGAVTQMLAELCELGIPNDPSLAAQALSSEAVRPIRTRPAQASDDPAQIVHGARVEPLQRVLQGEPQGFVAVLLAAGEWPWREAFLAAQEPAQRRALGELARGNAGGPRLQAQVVAAVAKRLRDAPAATAAASQGRKPPLLVQLRGLVQPMLIKVRK
jgi:hypothetical protein